MEIWKSRKLKSGKQENCKSGKVGIWKSRKLVFFGKVKNRKLENCKSGKVENWKIENRKSGNLEK